MLVSCLILYFLFNVGYIVTIRNASQFYIGNITLPGSTMRLQQDGLPSNTTYFVIIAAMTKVGIGIRIPEILVELRKCIRQLSPCSMSSGHW